MSIQVEEPDLSALHRSAAIQSVAAVPLRRQLIEGAGVALGGLLFGVLTAYGQGWLPDAVSSLANSCGPWALIAFTLALLARTYWTAAGFGALALAMLLAGYVLADGVRGYPSATSTTLFWTLAAVLGGPVLGLAAHWVRFKSANLAATGAGVISGVLISEGVYGLTALDQPIGYQHPGYWWAEIAVGIGLLLALVVARVRSLPSVLLGMAVCAGVVAGFLALSVANLLMYFG